MNTFLAILGCVLVALCNAKPTDRIVGGDFAKENQFPHQISLRSYGSHNCGGSILNNDWVVTAAHCVNAANPGQYVVVAGTINLSGGVSRNVQKIIVHEKYGNFMNDIALMKLSSPLEFSDAIQPIEVATEEVSDGKEVVISGWGRIYQGGPISDKLKFNTVLAVSKSECGSSTGMYFDGLICLGHPKDNGACNGDSGGPALFDGKLVGIANFVMGGCGTQYPDGYCKVSYYVDWLKENMK